ncbi:MAG: enoyl-ACP reductase [Psittacicella sp.]
MNFLEGKKILVTGIANNKSIAYGIAKAMHDAGAELAFTYLNDKLKERVEKVAEEFNSKIILPLDVSTDKDIENCFLELKNHWEKFDGFVHAIAFAPTDQLNGDFLEAVSREGFAIAHDISSYSLAAMAKYSRSMLNEGASIVALTYLGAERAVPNYNVMGLAKASLEANVRYSASALGAEGIRVNAVSAGPIRTLAASAIKDFRQMLKEYEEIAPLKRTVTIEDVGKTVAFLCSDLASGITGEVLHVDAGFHMVTI